MSSAMLLIISGISYLGASVYAYYLALNKRPLNHTLFRLLNLLSISLHGISLHTTMALNEGIDLSIHNMVSLVVLVINSLVIISSFKKPLHNLLLLLLPLSSLVVWTNIFSIQSPPHFISVTTGVTAHILLSIVAYSVLAIATLQALLWSWQSHQIKQHRVKGLTGLLPPLQTMELLMFEMLWAGVIFLALGIIFGFIYVDNIFDQQLVHKTVLSLFALVVFTGLLWGRHHLGWRGNIAVKWILGGFCLLMLAYFGSKVVLELILSAQ